MRLWALSLLGSLPHDHVLQGPSVTTEGEESGHSLALGSGFSCHPTSSQVPGGQCQELGTGDLLGKVGGLE